jgi:hypothetical protein
LLMAACRTPRLPRTLTARPVFVRRRSVGRANRMIQSQQKGPGLDSLREMDAHGRVVVPGPIRRSSSNGLRETKPAARSDSRPRHFAEATRRTGPRAGRGVRPTATWRFEHRSSASMICPGLDLLRKSPAGEGQVRAANRVSASKRDRLTGTRRSPAGSPGLEGRTFCSPSLACD